MSTPCLGESVAALVDGELGHAARERAHRHLAHCSACRAEVDAHRTLKARLSRLSVATPPPQGAFTDRLLALTAPGTDRIAHGPVGPARPVGLRPPSGPASTRPQGRRRALRRRTAVASAFAALGVAAVALGSAPTGARTPVDPGTDSFVVQHVETTSEVPRVVRATLTGGDARAPR